VTFQSCDLPQPQGETCGLRRGGDTAGLLRLSDEHGFGREARDGRGFESRSGYRICLRFP